MKALFEKWIKSKWKQFLKNEKNVWAYFVFPWELEISGTSLQNQSEDGTHLSIKLIVFKF